MINTQTDTAGTAFDPTIMQATRDGTPRVKRDGTFIYKKGKDPAKNYNTQPPFAANREFDDLFETPPITQPPPAESVSAGTSTIPQGLDDLPENDESETDPQQVSNAAAASLVVGITESTAQICLGDDMKMAASEREALAASWTSYFDETGGMQISPIWAVVIANATYLSKRINRPTVSERLAKVFNKIKSWF